MWDDIVQRLNRRALTLIALHILLAVYSLSGFFSKSAANVPFLSLDFCLFYVALLALLAVYAIGWQQILKMLPLTLAFANKAVTVVWGIVWGFVFFGEALTCAKLLGAAFIFVGIVLYSIADNDQNDSCSKNEEQLVNE